MLLAKTRPVIMVFQFSEAHSMVLLPLIINGIVIAAIGTELIAVSLGLVSADQLLVTSTISGLLTLLSFKLSKDALSLINGVPDSLAGQAADDA